MKQKRSLKKCLGNLEEHVLKKTFILTGIAISVIMLTGCNKQTSSNGIKYKSNTLYNTKITKIVSDDGYWKIKGTTNAPNGAKIIATPTNKDSGNYGMNQTAYTDLKKYSRVRNEKFSTKVTTIGSTKYSFDKFEDGQKSKMNIFAITKYNKDFNLPSISAKLLSKANRSFEPKTLKISLEQIKYLNKPSGKAVSSSDSSTSSTSSSSDISAAKKFENKLNSLNKGTAESVTYNSKTNTVTWIGFDDWKSWSKSELQKPMDLLQAMTLRQEVNYGISSVHIIVQFEDGTVIAKNSDTNEDLQIIK